jgi:hypothetical protein
VLTPRGGLYRNGVVAAANLLPRRTLEQSLERLRGRLREISRVGFDIVSERPASLLAG